MDGDGRFLVRGLGQAKNRAAAFVVPIFQELHPVLALDLQVLLVGLFDRLGRQALHILVNIHIERHLETPFFSLISILFLLRLKGDAYPHPPSPAGGSSLKR